MVLCVLLVGGMALYHLMGGAGDKTVVFVSPAIEAEQRQKVDSGSTELLPSRMSADGRTMTLIQEDRPADKFYIDLYRRRFRTRGSDYSPERTIQASECRMGG